MRRTMAMITAFLMVIAMFSGCKYQELSQPSLPSNTTIKNEQNNIPVDPTFDTSMDSYVGWIRDTKLYCEQLGIYSGRFVEDISDRKIDNIAAMLITNKSDRYLDIAMLTYEINGKTAEFKVTGLPAGKSAWVLESNAMQIERNPDVKFLDCVIAHRDDVVTQPDDINITYQGNSLKVTNESDRTFYHLYVYYKVLHADGNNLGGITYGVGFGDLAPGQTGNSLAAHFQEGKTEIIRVAWLDEPLPEIVN